MMFPKPNLITLIISVHILLVLGGSLINTEFFHYPALSAYFLYAFAVSLFAVLVGCLKISGKPQHVHLSIPVILIGLWCLYIFFNDLLYDKPSQIQNYYIINLAFLLVLISAFNQPKFNITLLFQLIFALAVLESVICLIQYLGWLKSGSEYFTVTGSLENPNVTAMFLAMTIPVILTFIRTGKKIVHLFTGLVIIALILLECRSAIIGVTLGTLVFMGHKYRFGAWLKNKRNRSALVILLLSGLAASVYLAQILYKAKKDSADGRKLIWKLSIDIIKENPLRGSGYGFFEQQYNLHQARYIALNRASPAELKNAGHVNMAYNEFLQNGVEGGLLGLLLFTGVLGALLFIPSKASIASLKLKESQPLVSFTSDHFIAAYSGIIVFSCMSAVNFTLLAVPLMCLFLVYAAVINQCLPAPNLLLLSFFGLKSFKLAGIVFIAAGAGIFYWQFTDAKLYRQNKVAIDLLRSNEPERAKNILSGLEPGLSYSENYWKNYANTLFLLKDYEGALSKIKQGLKLTSEPSLYLLSGMCYNGLKQYKQAVTNFQQAVYLEPGRFKPRYYLMVSAMRAGDTQKAIIAAQQLISLKPKIPSPQVQRYKRAAKKLLTKLKIHSLTIRSKYAY